MRRWILIAGGLVACCALAFGLLRHRPQGIDASVQSATVGAYWLAPLELAAPGRNVPHVQFLIEAPLRFWSMADEHVICGEARMGHSGPYFHLSGGDLRVYGDEKMTCVLTLNLEERSAGPYPDELLALLDAGATMYVQLQIWDGPKYVFQAESAWMTTAGYADAIRDGLR